MKKNEISKSLIDFKSKIVDKEKLNNNYNNYLDFLNKKDIKYYLNKIINIDVNELEENDLDNIENILSITNYIYNMTGNNTGISDREYDSIKEKYESIRHTENKSDYEFTSYPSLRGTLSKIYRLTEDDILKNKSQKSIDEWVNYILNKINKNSNDYNGEIWNERVFVCPKFDGVSAVCEYDEDGNLIKAVTRGDIENNKAKDITHIMSRVSDTSKGLFKGKRHGLKVEVIMKETDLPLFNERFGTTYTTARSAVSGILNSQKYVENDKIEFLNAIHLRYSYLDEHDNESEQHIAPMLETFPSLKCKLKDTDSIREFSFNNSNVYGFRCDGSVIIILNTDLHKILGRENGKMLYEVAFKFTEERTTCRVNSIKFTVGFTGKVNPVLTFDPVVLKGRTISRASISYGRLKENPLYKGDEITVIYDIVPYVDINIVSNHKKDAKELRLPKNCPECGKKLVESETGLNSFCINPKCGCIKKGIITNYISSLGIKGISYETISDLYDNKIISKIEDLYLLRDKVEDILELPGFKKKKLENMISAIESRDLIYESELLGSLGISGFGKKKFHDLLQQGTYDGILEMCFNGDWSSLATYRGIQAKNAKTLVEGIKANEDTIEFIENTIEILPEPMDLKSGMYVAFSKCRDKELEKWLSNRAIQVSDTVNNNVSFVVIPNMSSTSTKIERARKLKIPLVLLGENGEGVKEYIRKNYRKV